MSRFPYLLVYPRKIPRKRGAFEPIIKLVPVYTLPIFDLHFDNAREQLHRSIRCALPFLDRVISFKIGKMATDVLEYNDIHLLVRGAMVSTNTPVVSRGKFVKMKCKLSLLSLFCFFLNLIVDTYYAGNDSLVFSTTE